MYYIGWTVFFMDRKLKRWEVALLCGVLAALLWSCLLYTSDAADD